MKHRYILSLIKARLVHVLWSVFCGRSHFPNSGPHFQKTLRVRSHHVKYPNTKEISMEVLSVHQDREAPSLPTLTLRVLGKSKAEWTSQLPSYHLGTTEYHPSVLHETTWLSEEEREEMAEIKKKIMLYKERYRECYLSIDVMSMCAGWEEGAITSGNASYKEWICIS